MTLAVAPVAEREDPAVGRIGDILRDMARGGLAGAVAGVVVAGLGGRLVMRLAAIVVPESAGRFTENGNFIGEITLAGTLALVLFGGLFFGLFGGILWVIVAPWLPKANLWRAMLAGAIAVCLTGISLIRGDNHDFVILKHDPLVLAMLLGLVAVTGLSLAILDGWLDRHLPCGGDSIRSDAFYAVLALAGGLLILPIVVQIYFGFDVRLGLALGALGLATLAWWVRRYQGLDREWTLVPIVGRAALLVACGIGLLDLVPEVAGALAIE